MNRIAPQLAKLESLEADILVLTEAHETLKPRGFPFCAAADSQPGYHLPGETFVSIWSRFPITAIPTAPENQYFTLCCEIEGPLGIGKAIVYGTILTYHADGVREGLAKPWERHRAAVGTQTAEWIDLSRRYSSDLRIVAGDFNENLDGKRWYGVKAAKEAILEGLAVADMRCATKDPDLPLLTGDKTLSRSTVDHICISKNRVKGLTVRAWEGTDGDLVLSDHNGIVVDIAL